MSLLPAPALIAPAIPQQQQALLESGGRRFVSLARRTMVRIPVHLEAGEHALRIDAGRIGTSGDIAFEAILKDSQGRQVEKIQFYDNVVKSTERVTLNIESTFNGTLEIQQSDIGEPCLLRISLDTEEEPEPEPFSFSPTRPKLTVLVHGITSEPRQAPEQGIATSRHARWYWGFGFIRAVLGTPSAGEALLCQPHRGGSRTHQPVSDTQWKNTANLSQHTTDLAPLLLPALTVPDSPTGPNRAVMVTYRDGSKHLMPQVGAAIDQIYESYLAVFGSLPKDRQPQIYLVGHSFGGVVCRTILSNPEGSDLFGNRLTEQQRERADFLRSRTVLLATLSTPHMGSPIPDQANDISAYLRRTGKSVGNLLAPVDSLTNSTPLKQLGLGTNLVKASRSKLQGALDMVSGERDCLADIQRMPEYNQGILAPAKARRPDGTAVPIYTMAGRVPSGLFVDRSRAPWLRGGRVLPYSILDIADGGRPGDEADKLYLIQSFLHHAGYGKEGIRPWGSASIPDADLYTSAFKGIGPPQARRVSEPLDITLGLTSSVLHSYLRGRPYENGRDGETDNDGFVGFDSAHGLNLQGGIWCRVYGEARYGEHHTWDWDNHGSLMFNVGNGLWIYNELLERASPTSETLPTKRHGIKIEILEVHDVDNKLDLLPGNDADFSLMVRIAGERRSKNLPDGQRTVKNAATFTKTGMLQSVIPIRIDITERDSPDPEDLCAIYPYLGRDNLYVFYDTRTRRIYGDVQGRAGDTLSVAGKAGVYNRVLLKFRITGLP